MVADVISKAEAALAERNYDSAVELFTQAAEADGENASIYLGRAKANNKLENFLEAAADGDKAIELDPKLAAAHKEKGHALYGLEEYESAKLEFEAASVLEPTKRIHKEWVKMCMSQLGEEFPQEERSAMPDLTAAKPSPATLPQQPKQEKKEEKPAITAVSIDDPEYSKYWRAPVAPAAAAVPSGDCPASLYRHQWFQTDAKVEVNVLAKKVPADRVTVDMDRNHLKVVIRDGEGNIEYELDLDLHGAIVPEGSKCNVLSTKIEIRLEKADQGIAWPALEAAAAKQEVQAAAPAPVQAAPAPYPYAGKKVDWEKVEKEALKEEEEEELEGDAAVMRLFKKLYADAGEDTRRAMMKSYQESGGKALSMNWEEVGKKDYRKEFKD